MIRFFITKTGKNSKMSPMEKLIFIKLRYLQVKFFREVSFENLISSKGGYLRFDFCIPSKNLIIEYDGEKWHKSKLAQARDKKKNKFCKDNKIKLVRLTKIHLPELDKILKKLVK